jgi:HrpA-like RNA helicase
MILNECTANNQPCRIFCTQPRRLAALSIAERVAAERGEMLARQLATKSDWKAGEFETSIQHT